MSIVPTVAGVLESWAARVRANREQVERLRESSERADFYAPIAHRFRADPRRQDDAVLNTLVAFARPGERWLDIGAGGGRYALPLALKVGEVVALDPSEGMLQTLRDGMSEYAITGVRPVMGRWPPPEPDQFATDVAMIANVGHDVEQIGPFIQAMDRAAARARVAVMLDRPPPWLFDQMWPALYGEPRVALPALPELLVLLLALEHRFELRLHPRDPFAYRTVDDAMLQARQQLWTRPGSERDRHLRRLVEERLVERDGALHFTEDQAQVGVVTW